MTKLIQVATMAMALLAGGCFCGAGPGQTEASLYLTDGANGRTVKAPVFSEDGATVAARCGEMDHTDPTLCTSQLLVLGHGAHRITVSATGYTPAMVTVDTTTVDSVHLAVELKAAK